jgi:hypothetical protein
MASRCKILHPLAEVYLLISDDDGRYESRAAGQHRQYHWAIADGAHVSRQLEIVSFTDVNSCKICRIHFDLQKIEFERKPGLLTQIRAFVLRHRKTLHLATQSTKLHHKIDYTSFI